MNVNSHTNRQAAFCHAHKGFAIGTSRKISQFFLCRDDPIPNLCNFKIELLHLSRLMCDDDS